MVQFNYIIYQQNSMNKNQLADEVNHQESISDIRTGVALVQHNQQMFAVQKTKINTKTIVLIILASFLLINVLIYVYWEHSHQMISDSYVISQQEQQIFTITKNKAIQAELRLAKQNIHKFEAKLQIISENLRKSEMEKEKESLIIDILQQKIDETESTIKSLTKKTSELPLQLPFINGKNERIEDVLYSNQSLKDARVKFHQQRITFINQHSDLPSLHLAKHNLVLDQAAAKLAKTDFSIEWERLQKKFQLSKITTELPMCIVSTGYNNNDKFRIEYSLNSIFTQNYTNYKAVIINDASTDGSDEVYRKYFEFYQIDKAHYTYIENQERITSLENLYLATINHCSKDSIVITLDADDEFNGRNVLKVFNWGYTTKKSGVLYSNYYFYQPPTKVKGGFTKEYSDNEKKNNLYRDVPMRFSQLRSFRAEIISKINTDDWKDDQGKYFTITADLALFMPLMELSCGRVNKIDAQYHYIYNTNTGLNDFFQRPRQAEVEKRIRATKKYKCDQDFENRMKNLP